MSSFCFRNLALKALFTTMLGGGAMMSHAALAKAPELYFYPTKAWNIAQRDAGCVAQNEFNNGFMMRFVGTTQWVNALDINVRQNAFKAGELYDVNVSVPGLAYTVKKAPAVSGDTLRVDLKGNKELYKKMRASGVVDMTIEGNDFRFYLTGFANSAIEFERCMSGGGATKPAPAQDDGLVARFSDDQKQLVSSAHSITSQDRDAYTTNEAMALEAKTKAKTLDAANAPKVKLSEEIAQRIEDDPTIIALEPAKPAFKNEKAIEADLVAPPLDKVMDAQEGIVAPSAPVPEESSLLPVPSAPEKVEWNETKAAAKVMNIKTPEHKVTTEKSYGEADFRNVPDESTASITRTESNSVLLDKITGLETKLGLMASENIALTQDLKQALRAAQKENLSIASENWNLEQATMQFNEAERQIKRLGVQLQSERAKCAAEKKELETMLFDPQLTNDSQMARLATLEQQLNVAKGEIESQRLRYEEQIRMLRAAK